MLTEDIDSSFRASLLPVKICYCYQASPSPPPRLPCFALLEWGAGARMVSIAMPHSSSVQFGRNTIRLSHLRFWSSTIKRQVIAERRLFTRRPSARSWRR